jgi:hypothetical protein
LGGCHAQLEIHLLIEDQEDKKASHAAPFFYPAADDRGFA